MHEALRVRLFVEDNGAISFRILKTTKQKSGSLSMREITKSLNTNQASFCVFSQCLESKVFQGAVAKPTIYKAF